MTGRSVTTAVTAAAVTVLGTVAASGSAAPAAPVPPRLPAAQPVRRRPPLPATTVLGTTVLGTTVPGAPGCPMFPADNVWNTNISKLPADPHSAAWLRSMDSASTYLHPDFGPDPGGYPYGIPFTVVTSKHPTVAVAFQYASESYRGRYPFGSDTPIEGGKNAGGDRHAIMVNSSTCTLYELWNARYAAGQAEGRVGCPLAAALERATAGRLDLS